MMMTAASVSADIISREADSGSNEIIEKEIPIDEGNLISPGPEEPLIISPIPNFLPEETDYTDNLVIAGDTTKNSESKDIDITGLTIIVVFAGIIVTVLIIKRKSK